MLMHCRNLKQQPDYITLGISFAMVKYLTFTKMYFALQETSELHEGLHQNRLATSLFLNIISV